MRRQTSQKLQANKVALSFMHLLRVASHRTVPDVEVEEGGTPTHARHHV